MISSSAQSFKPIICRTLAIPGSSINTTLNPYISGKHVYGLTLDTALQRLQQKATHIGYKRLGFQPSDIGLHSLCASAAMAMVLAGVPTYMVILIERWRSDAFLTYICKQVAKFSSTVSCCMITITTFFHPPDKTNLQAPFTSWLTLARQEAQAMATKPHTSTLNTQKWHCYENGMASAHCCARPEGIWESKAKFAHPALKPLCSSTATLLVEIAMRAVNWVKGVFVGIHSKQRKSSGKSLQPSSMREHQVTVEYSYNQYWARSTAR